MGGVQGNRSLLGLAVTLVGAVILTTLTVFTQMNRNGVLSRMDGTAPGVVTWDRSYITGLMVHGAVPLLTLISVKYPDASRLLQSVVNVFLKHGGG